MPEPPRSTARSAWGRLRDWLRAEPPEPQTPDAARARAETMLRSFTWPPALLRALGRLREGGGAAVIVGGTVRDVLLGRPLQSPADVATSVLPGEVMRRFERVEPIGLAHGTVLVLDFAVALEVTTFRREGGYADARHPDRVDYTSRLEDDLARRDFTINALAYDPSTGTLVDPHGGSLDLERGVLRAVGEPRLRFHEDALRPLRAARLAATLELEIDAETAAALGSARDRAALVAMERVREEWSKLLGAPAPSVGLEHLRRAGLLELWAPEVARGYGVLQNEWHAWDVYEHSLRVCDAAPASKPRVRWAALLHDIGKPDTRVIRDGRVTFYGHAEVGATLADRLLERFRMPNVEREAIVHLVREHMFDYRREWSDAALRRWLRGVGLDAVADLFDLRIADALGTGRERGGFPSQLEELRERIDRLIAAAQVLQVRDLAIDGHDVMHALDLPPGPRVGAALDALLDLVLEHPEMNAREPLLRALEQWAARGVSAAPEA